MIEIRSIEQYSKWYQRLRDREAQSRVLIRLRRLSLGNFGDVAPVGEGVSELRIHYGPGYRVYFVSRGDRIIILLGGGDKSTQDKDIAAAKALAKSV
ncbi:MAG: type II toxin-antitoxin system RelE/ParE family toxin [Hyphomicrobiales bacterium]|nr:type II toxin-antitoxin system RelE/ParE family toxin [Hyphomicrobiales bacterium]